MTNKYVCCCNDCSLWSKALPGDPLYHDDLTEIVTDQKWLVGELPTQNWSVETLLQRGWQNFPPSWRLTIADDAEELVKVDVTLFNAPDPWTTLNPLWKITINDSAVYYNDSERTISTASLSIKIVNQGTTWIVIPYKGLGNSNRIWIPGPDEEHFDYGLRSNYSSIHDKYLSFSEHILEDMPDDREGLKFYFELPDANPSENLLNQTAIAVRQMSLDGTKRKLCPPAAPCSRTDTRLNPRFELKTIEGAPDDSWFDNLIERPIDDDYVFVPKVYPKSQDKETHFSGFCQSFGQWYVNDEWASSEIRHIGTLLTPMFFVCTEAQWAAALAAYELSGDLADLYFSSTYETPPAFPPLSGPITYLAWSVEVIDGAPEGFLRVRLASTLSCIMGTPAWFQNGGGDYSHATYRWTVTSFAGHWPYSDPSPYTPLYGSVLGADVGRGYKAGRYFYGNRDVPTVSPLTHIQWVKDVPNWGSGTPPTITFDGSDLTTDPNLSTWGAVDFGIENVVKSTPVPNRDDWQWDSWVDNLEMKHNLLRPTIGPYAGPIQAD